MKNRCAVRNRVRGMLNRTDPNMPVILLILTIIAAVSIILAISLGPVSLPPGTVARIAGSRILFFRTTLDTTGKPWMKPLSGYCGCPGSYWE